MRVLFEIRRFNGENAIFIDNQLFDWRLDDIAIEEIKKITDESKLKLINKSVKDYFLSSLESFVGKKITIRQVIESIESGYIEL